MSSYNGSMNRDNQPFRNSDPRSKRDVHLKSTVAENKEKAKHGIYEPTQWDPYSYRNQETKKASIIVRFFKLFKRKPK